MGKKASPKIATFRIDELVAADYNPRSISEEALAGLAKSIERFGCVEPIVVNIRGGKKRIVGGHQRAKALQSLGVKDVMCVTINCTSAEEKLLNLSLNNPLIQGEFIENLDKYINDLQSTMPDDKGFLDLRISELRGEIANGKAGLIDDDEVPEPPKKAITKTGDLWLLGDHRLLCGDSTKKSYMERLCGQETAIMMWTDPPYGVNYVGKTKDALIMKNDSLDGLLNLLLESFANIQNAVIPSGHWYIAHPPGPIVLIFGDVIRQLQWKLHQTLVWIKDSMVLGHSDYHYRHEPIFYGYMPGEGRPGRGNHEGSLWKGNNSQTTVFEISRPKCSETHPIMKPVALIEIHLQNSSDIGDIVVDPFGGSGSTLIACEKLNRRCFGMEIDPIYCDVIIKRWEEFTGKKAVLEKGS